MWYNRTILEQILKTTKNYSVTLVTGARHVGKTELVKTIEKERGYNYITLFNEDLLKESIESPKKFLEKYKPPVIIYEFQRNQKLFNEIQYIVEKVKLEKGSQAAKGLYILTGSQKYKLMKNITQSLAGRVGIIEMPPLSQSEIQF